MCKVHRQPILARVWGQHARGHCHSTEVEAQLEKQVGKNEGGPGRRRVWLGPSVLTKALMLSHASPASPFRRHRMTSRSKSAGGGDTAIAAFAFSPRFLYALEPAARPHPMLHLDPRPSCWEPSFEMQIHHGNTQCWMAGEEALWKHCEPSVPIPKTQDVTPQSSVGQSVIGSPDPQHGHPWGTQIST